MTKRVTKNNVIQLASKGKIRIDHLSSIYAKTQNQEKVKAAYKDNANLLLHGIAGTGKTYMALALALEEVLDPSTNAEKILIIRSIVPTRDIGFLKGDHEEKVSVYEAPYKAICEELFSVKNAYDTLKSQNVLEFISTSFIRGITLNNCVIIVDEIENLNFHELDSVITRVGEGSKIVFCGDYSQSDFTKAYERKGLLDFMKVLKSMNNFVFIEFDIDDIVRSNLVKDYIIAKARLGIDT